MVWTQPADHNKIEPYDRFRKVRATGKCPFDGPGDSRPLFFADCGKADIAARPFLYLHRDQCSAPFRQQVDFSDRRPVPSGDDTIAFQTQP